MQNRMYMASGYLFEINLKYNTFLQKVVVTSINLNHQGHDISPEIYASIYPKNRKISDESKDYINNTLTLNPNTQALKGIIQDRNPVNMNLNSFFLEVVLFNLVELCFFLNKILWRMTRNSQILQ